MTVDHTSLTNFKINLQQGNPESEIRPARRKSNK